MKFKKLQMGRIYFISITFLLGVCSNFFSGCSDQENFLVWRTVNSTANEYWHSSRDKFTIPDSVCKNISVVNPCFLYDSFTTGKTCDCKCPYLKPSFRFYNGNLRCMDDAAMKKTEGMLLKLVFIFQLLPHVRYTIV